MVDAHDLILRTDIAAKYEVAEHSVRRWEQNESFPKAVAVFGGKKREIKVFLESQVDAWHNANSWKLKSAHRSIDPS